MAMPVNAPAPLASVFRTTRAPVPSFGIAFEDTGSDGYFSAVTTSSSPPA